MNINDRLVTVTQAGAWAEANIPGWAKVPVATQREVIATIADDLVEAGKTKSLRALALDWARENIKGWGDNADNTTMSILFRASCFPLSFKLNVPDDLFDQFASSPKITTVWFMDRDALLDELGAALRATGRL